MTAYTPDIGDIAWVEFSPQTGREMKDRHPALILTPAAYSIATGLALVAPITSKAKGGSFEVPLLGAKKAKGVVLANELRSIDYMARKATPFDKCPPSVLQRVRDIAEALVLGR